MASAQTRTIAVLGGGVSGLAAAFSLSNSLPNHKFIVLEAQNCLGGYVRSKRVRVHEPHINNHVTALIERGPRSLMPGRYKGLRTVEMVCFVFTLAIPAWAHEPNGSSSAHIQVCEEPLSLP